MSAFITAWTTTVGLLAAIGAQNAFVIESAIQRRHIVIVALTCILSDFVMISAGLLGLSQVMKAQPQAQAALAWVGIAFLVYYGLFKLRESFKVQSLKESSQKSLSPLASIFKTLGFSWLNPHVYLDTVILIPALALQYTDQNRNYAALGGYLGVVTWFAGISGLGVLSARLFQNPRSWRILNLVTAVIMFWVAFHLFSSLQTG
ncbi:MAG: LysE/ArgO family amino acid transporter [Bdellovibrionales bacterium]